MKKQLGFLLFFALSALANPDLAVTTVQASAISMPPAPDGSLRIDFIIRNIGNQTAFNFWVEGYSNRQQSCSVGLRKEAEGFFQSLPAGQQISGTFLIYSQPGDTSLFAVVKADTTNAVIENSETNNCLPSLTITVRNPDLFTPSTSAPAPLKVVPGGEPVSFITNVRNHSAPNTGWPAGDSHLRYFVSTALTNPPPSSRIALSSFTPKIPEDGTVVVTADIGLPTGFPLGTYNLFSKADGDDEVFERNENNNFSTSVPIQVVDMCTLADVNGSGSVNIQDLILLVNGAVSLVTPANQHLDLRRSPVPFPPLINREDFLAALPCFGTFSFENALGGSFSDFAVVATGAGTYRLDLSLTGQVAAMSCYLVKPNGSALATTQLLDRLASGYTVQLNPQANDLLLANEFHGTAMSTRELTNGSFASFSADFDMSKLRTVTHGDDFDAGIAVQVTFGNGTRAVIMKRFDYLELPDPALRTYVEQLYGLTPGSRIPASLTAATTSLNLSGLGIANLDGVQHFRQLRTIDVSDNNLTATPDLSRMTTLKNFWAQANQIQQLGPLPVGLETLVVSFNELDEVSAISGLNQLFLLAVDYNHLKSLPDLTAMTRLDFLTCASNEIAALPGLPASLSQLYAYDNRLARLQNMTGLQLEVLDLHQNYLYDLTPLANLTWPANAYCDLTTNNLDASDCTYLEQLNKRVADLFTVPQRSVTTPCIFSHDQ